MARKAKKTLSPNQVVVLALLVTLLFVQAVGLYVGSKLIAMPEIQPVTDAVYGVGIFLYILIATGIVLLIIRYKRKALKIMELLAIFIASEIFFEVLFMGVLPQSIGVSLAFGLAILLTASRVLYNNMFTQNLAMVCSIIGVGAILGASLGFLPALILLGLLTIYDIVAVFKTKHMVTMAKEIVKQRLAFTMAIPTKGHIFQIGGGDMVMPLVFSIAVMREFGTPVAIATVVGSMVMLMAFFAWLVDRPGKAYPALPPVTIGAILGWMLGVLLL